MVSALRSQLASLGQPQQRSHKPNNAVNKPNIAVIPNRRVAARGESAVDANAASYPVRSCFVHVQADLSYPGI